MPTHAERRHLPYRADQLFDVVADVERYPEFLPWCTGARVRSRDDDVIVADLLIGFRMVREKFTSTVTLHRPDRVDVAYSEGPFKYLENHWKFEPQPDGSCIIDFYVDFEFRSKMLQRLIGVLFNEAVRRMVGAFEGRAKQLYGTSPADGAASRPAGPGKAYSR